jgi:hypothetical protein
MSGSAELQMEFDQGPLTANLQGGYSIVSDPETTLKPIVVPYMMSRKWSSRNVDLSVCLTMRCQPCRWVSRPIRFRVERADSETVEEEAF